MADDIIEYNSTNPGELYAPIDSMTLAGNATSEASHGADRAEKDEGAMSLVRLEELLEDQRLEGRWRAEADKAADYYDGNQLDRDTIEALEEKGLGALVRNLAAPTIDAVLGLEERSRLDWRVTSDYEDQEEIAQALTVKLTEAERETGADRAMSDAYKGQVVSGFSAIEVSRQTNPYMYPYRVQHIHRRELGWDQRSRAMDWSDARYVMRRRWYDVDIVCAHFPMHTKLIKAAAGGEATWQLMLRMSGMESADLLSAMALERDSSIENSEWRDIERNRVCVWEVHYRTYHRGIVMKLPRGRIVEYDPNNAMHVAAIASGRVKPIESVYDKFRCAYFVGPHRLADFSTGRRRFPYVPFWGKREDLTGAPYGLMRSLMSVQDEINARLAKMMWYLTSRRTVVDDDAVDGKAAAFNTMSALSREVGRADSFIVLNSQRRNQQALQVDANMTLADSQHRAMLDAINAMPMVSGVYAPMLGQNTNTTANSAIQTLLDQGVTTLAELNSNFLYGRRQVGEALLELCKEDLIEPMEVTVDTGVLKRKIFLNQPMKDQSGGLASVQNNVAASAVKVQLDDTPATPSYRAKQFAQISEVVKSLPPNLQAIVAPFLIETSDMSHRKEVAKIMRDQLGIGTDPTTPEGQQAMQAQQATQQIQARAAEAEIAVKEAQAKKLQAEALMTSAKAAAVNDPNHPEHKAAQDERELRRRALEIKGTEVEAKAAEGGRVEQLAREIDEQLAAMALKMKR